ncbi:MAG TPA: glutamate racemase [Steroidobacteraceae bacterium]|nr:glutamate racemase [Steroidobacteraceae bacterium]
MSDSPIGVFDSGVGGLTVLKALAEELPHERFVYLGDTARLPYGTKSAETVARYAVQAAEALTEYGVKSLVIACNTASSVGLPAIRQHIDNIPIIGVIEPGAQAACRASHSGHIVVIATEGTVRGGAYQEAILRLRANAHVIAQPTQLFVALAEEGLHEGAIAEQVARHYLTPLFHSGPAAAADTLVLGCTHFPMLAAAIRAAVGPAVNIVDSAATTAKAVRAILEGQKLTRAPAEGTRVRARGPGDATRAAHDSAASGAGEASATRFLATDSVERFARIGSLFLSRPITPAEVELVDL